MRNGEAAECKVYVLSDEDYAKYQETGTLEGILDDNQDVEDPDDPENPDDEQGSEVTGTPTPAVEPTDEPEPTVTPSPTGIVQE